MNSNLILEPFTRVGMLTDIPDIVVIGELLIQMLGDLLDFVLRRECHPKNSRSNFNYELLLTLIEEQPIR
jgi:hypothetical protein